VRRDQSRYHGIKAIIIMTVRESFYMGFQQKRQGPGSLDGRVGGRRSFTHKEAVISEKSPEEGQVRPMVHLRHFFCRRDSTIEIVNDAVHVGKQAIPIGVSHEHLHRR
jgi:hypothetical protein